MFKPLKIGSRFTHTLKGCRIGGLYVDADDVPRIVVYRVQHFAVSLLHTSLLNVREETGWGWLPAVLLFGLILAAWFYPKALSASSGGGGVPNLAQIAWSLS